MRELKNDRKKGKINRDDEKSEEEKNPPLSIQLPFLCSITVSIWTHNHIVHQTQTSN